MPGNADADKKEFLADVSSFANTAGGDLIFGIEEKQGVPTGNPGLNVADFDLEIRRLESMIGDGIDPRIRQSIRVVERKGKPALLVVRVERSWIGPHRVVFKGHDKFYAPLFHSRYPFRLFSTVFRSVRISQFRSCAMDNSTTVSNSTFGNSPNTVLLDPGEVAQILRVPRSWVYSHLSELPVIRLGRYVRFRRSEIERFIEQRA